MFIFKKIFLSLFVLCSFFVVIPEKSIAQTVGAAGILYVAPTPVGNTFDPANKAAGITLSNGNLTATQASGGWVSAKGLTSYAITTEKRYFELVFASASAGNIIYGFGNASASVNNYCGSDANGWGYYASVGWVLNSGGAVNFYATYTTGDVMMCAIDAAAGKIWFGKNGVWLSGNPATGTSPAATGLTGSLVPMISGQSAWSGTANFGATTFTYTPPSGYTGY